MDDRNSVSGPVCGTTIEVVGENGFDRAVGARADVDRARGSSLKPVASIGSGEPDDAEADAEALLRMRPLVENEIAQRHGRGPDRRGILPDPLDGPAGVAPMAGRHVLGHGGVLVIAAHALMRGDPLALVEDLHSMCGEPHLDLGADEAVRNAVVVICDIDVIID